MSEATKPMMLAAVGAGSRYTAAMAVREVAGGGASTEVALGGNVFWGDAVFKPVVMRGERMERTAEIEVFGYV